MSPGAANEIVLDNLEVRPLNAGVRAAQKFISTMSDILNSADVKALLTSVNLGSVGASVVGAIGSSGSLAAPLLAVQSFTLAAASKTKLAARLFSFAELVDPPGTAYDVTFDAQPIEYKNLVSFSGLDPVISSAIQSYIDAVNEATVAGRSLEETTYRYATAGLQGDIASTLLQAKHAGVLLILTEIR